jgi:hypothetical protein
VSTARAKVRGGARRKLAARWPDGYQLDVDQSMTVLTWLKDLGGVGL